MLGIVLVDKPLGISSHDAVAKLRRQLGVKRIGHAGTLDPLATGLLVVAVGPATRFLQYLSLEPKVYEARIFFGKVTTSYDAEGDVLSEVAAPEGLVNLAEEKKSALLGLIDQRPPIFSAIKKDGRPLYSYARKGEEVEVPIRRIFVESMELMNSDGPELTYRIVCSGGAYVRSLAHDLGQLVGCGAHLSGLRRTEIGRFSVKNAKPPEQVTSIDLAPLAEALAPLRITFLAADLVFEFQNGRFLAGERVGAEPANEGEIMGFESEDGFLGIGRFEGNFWRPECVLPREAMLHV